MTNKPDKPKVLITPVDPAAQLAAAKSQEIEVIKRLNGAVQIKKERGVWNVYLVYKSLRVFVGGEKDPDKATTHLKSVANIFAVHVHDAEVAMADMIRAEHAVAQSVAASPPVAGADPKAAKPLMVECEECDGTGETQSTCTGCSALLHEGDEEGACKSCIAEDEASPS